MNENSSTPSKSTGLTRIWRAIFYSLSGLRTALQTEASFRQEIVLSIILLPILFFITVPAYIKWLILFAHVLVLVAELLNSAIEAVVDLVSPGYHDLAKQAKDLGSAAVLLTLIPTTALWGYVIYWILFIE